MPPPDPASPRADARSRQVEETLAGSAIHRDWVDHYCPVDADNGTTIRIVVTGDHDNKEHYIRECGLHHFIDDRTLTCEQLFAAGLSPIVFTQPWNRDQHNLPAVANWDEILDLFDLD